MNVVKKSVRQAQVRKMHQELSRIHQETVQRKNIILHLAKTKSPTTVSGGAKV